MWIAAGPCQHSNSSFQVPSSMGLMTIHFCLMTLEVVQLVPVFYAWSTMSLYIYMEDQCKNLVSQMSKFMSNSRKLQLRNESSWLAVRNLSC
jgi:uncharacterized membrane protein required for colicin V production